MYRLHHPGYLNDGDTLVQMRHRKLIVVAGQSNASGQQGTAAITNTQRTGIGSSFSRVNLRQKLSQPNAADPIVWTTDYTGPLISYTASQNNVSGHGVDGTGLGPSLSMGRHLDYYAANRVDICNVAVSGSTLATNWLPSVNWPSGGTNLFNQMVTIVNAAAASFGSSIAAFVWIQGEGDAADSTMASNYQTNLTALFNAVRAQWPGVPIVFNQLSNSNSGAFKATVRTAQSNVAGAFSSCTMIGVDDLTLTDGQHFNADSYAALGDRLGSALVTALGLASPVSWTIDPYSLIGTPSTEAEVIAMLAAAGITWPGGNMGLWLCQETSGNLTDSSNAGAFGMTAGGTGTTYATSNINWQRKELFFPEGTTGVFSTTSASLPDPSTTGQFRIGYVFLGAATTVKRNVFVIGTAGFTTLGRDPTAPGTFWQLTDGANTTADTSHAVTGSFRPWVLARRKAAGTIDAYVDNAHISGTLGTVTGKKAFIGAGSNPLHAVNWVLDLYGSGAEFSTAQTRTILNTLNWGNTNLGASAIPW